MSETTKLLAELKRLLKSRTQGEWFGDGYIFVRGSITPLFASINGTEQDARLAAAAVNALQPLIDRVRELEGNEIAADTFWDQRNRARQERDQLRTKLEQPWKCNRCRRPDLKLKHAIEHGPCPSRTPDEEDWLLREGELEDELRELEKEREAAEGK